TGINARVVHAVDEKALDALSPEIKSASCAIDALLGTGLDRKVEGLNARAIELLDRLACPVIAADIPSGLSADTGMPLGVAVHACVTVTFGLPKLGLFIGLGPDHAGRVEVLDIGIPAEEIAAVEARALMIEPSMFAPHFPRRTRTGHKGTYGHAAIFAGSGGHLGAGYLAALAALRAGCGLVTYCMPEAAFSRFDTRTPEIMCDALPDDGKGYFTPSGLAHAVELLKKMDAVAIGPAIGTDIETRAFANSLFRELKKPLVIDADGLNVLGVDSLRERASPTILTPHPGEMARLQGVSISEVQADRLGNAAALAKRSGAVVVLKGAATVVATPDGECAINPTGNPGMASAGMGDALTGIIASFLAQGMDAHTASIAGVYLHGLAGDIAAEDFGESSVIATDVIERLGLAINEVVR
ncbi:MAG: NAD(P)H-hydrate dehydratase, partial [bacterium]